jgi:hypothetical protein
LTYHRCRRNAPAPLAPSLLARDLLPHLRTRSPKQAGPAAGPTLRVEPAPRCFCPDRLAAAQLLLPSLPRHTRPLCLREGHGLFASGLRLPLPSPRRPPTFSMRGPATPVRIRPQPPHYSSSRTARNIPAHQPGRGLSSSSGDTAMHCTPPPCTPSPCAPLPCTLSSCAATPLPRRCRTCGPRPCRATPAPAHAPAPARRLLTRSARGCPPGAAPPCTSACCGRPAPASARAAWRRKKRGGWGGDKGGGREREMPPVEEKRSARQKRTEEKEKGNFPRTHA